MSLGARIQSKSAEYQKLQSDLAVFVDKKTRLDTQLSENETVKKEFVNLTPNNTIYKVVGPVLVPQEHSEARTNIETRLDFIRGEMKRVDTQIKDTEDQLEKKKLELVDLQSQLPAPTSAAASS
ncbi:Prefoldin [Tylopilus felleus]